MIPDSNARSIIKGQVKVRSPAPSGPPRVVETPDDSEDFTAAVADVSESESEEDQVKFHTAAPARPPLKRCTSRVVETGSENEEPSTTMLHDTQRLTAAIDYPHTHLRTAHANAGSGMSLNPHVPSPFGQHLPTPLQSEPSPESEKDRQNDILTTYGIDILKVAGRVPPMKFPTGL
jgi:hypothetical protein